MQATTIRPYWQSDDGRIRVYHARTGDAGPAYAHLPDVLVMLADELRGAALIHADPPYGMSEETDRRGRGGRKGPGRKGWECREWAPIVGDDRPFDPAPVLALRRPSVLWGANHYADKMPASASWLVWDKRDGVMENNNSDAEMAWTNIGASVRVFRHLWAGLVRASEVGEKVLGPTQKPIALCSWVYARAKLRSGDLVFVPYLGSGPDLPAAAAMGLRCVAVDVCREYLDTAIGARLGAMTSERAAQPAGPLFSRVG